MSGPRETASSSADSAANLRTTLLMYVGTTADVLDRARKATEPPRARPAVARIT